MAPNKTLLVNRGHTVYSIWIQINGNDEQQSMLWMVGCDVSAVVCTIRIYMQMLRRI